MVGTQYFPVSEVQQQKVVEYPGVTSQQEPPHSEGGSLEGWGRGEGTCDCRACFTWSYMFVYIHSSSYDGGVL